MPAHTPPAAFFDLFKLGVLLVATYQFNVDSGAASASAVLWGGGGGGVSALARSGTLHASGWENTRVYNAWWPPNAPPPPPSPPLLHRSTLCSRLPPGGEGPGGQQPLRPGHCGQGGGGRQHAQGHGRPAHDGGPAPGMGGPACCVWLLAPLHLAATACLQRHEY